MGTNNKQSILEGRKWDVIESIDGYFSGEKNGVIIQGATMSELYEKCKDGCRSERLGKTLNKS